MKRNTYTSELSSSKHLLGIMESVENNLTSIGYKIYKDLVTN
jgi:hypothetical protein